MFCWLNVLFLLPGARIREEEEEEEEGLDVSLSECVSSVSIGEWDEDALSDSQHIH